MRIPSRYLLGLSLLAGLTLPALCVSSAAGAEDTIKKSFTVTPGGTLFVDVDRGSIDIATGTGNEIRVEVVRSVDRRSRRSAEDILNEHKVEFTQDGGNLRIYSRYNGGDRGFWGWRNSNLRVRYIISTPRSYNADLRTAGGGISTSDLDGEVKARTSGGSLKFGRVTGPVWGRTSGGSITLQACKRSVDVESSGGSLKIGEVDGSVTARTSGGSIEIARVKGSVTARTSGGGIRVNEVFGQIDASTSGGSVAARLSSQPEGNCTLRTSGGSIDVHLAETVAVDLDASTSGGRVSTEFPVTVQGELKRTALRTKVNGGGPALVLRTSGGNVHIRRL